MLTLTPAMKKFILHWGELGAAWGINRSVAQVHALLYLAARPVHAEEIAKVLDMARSNVSTSLRELSGWGLIRVAHVLGDRRDHYESLSDVWEMFSKVLEERRKREVEPALRVLTDCLREADESGKEPEEVRKRLRAMKDFIETADGWYLRMRGMPREAVTSIFKVGAVSGKVKRLLSSQR